MGRGMLSDPRDIREFRDNLKFLGRQRVREFVAQHRFPEDELPIVEKWLEENDQETQARLQRDANRIAREANLIASATIALSLLAIFVSLAALKYQSSL
jgi:hypothetical protein